MVNAITSRIKPQLIRKRAIISLPKTVKIVIQPSQQKVANLQQIKQAQTQIDSRALRAQPAQPAQPKPQSPSNAAVSQKGLSKRDLRRKTQVTYITRSATPESVAKTQALRNTGKGKSLIIIGNGPSILEAPLEKLRNHSKIDTLSINKPDSRLWPTTYWAFFDSSQLRRHEDLWTSYNGIIFNSTSIKKQKERSMQFKNIGGKGFSKDASKGIHIGRSSVFAAMQIGLWMGYEKIYVFGCDMNPEGINGKLHFYGDNPDVDPGIRKNRFKDEAVHYDHAATILSPEERSKFVFCTEYNTWGFIKEFGHMSHKNAVEHIIEQTLEIA